MHKIVFLDRSTLGPRVVLRRPGFAHSLQEHAQTSQAEVLGRLAGATIAIVNKVDLRADVLSQLPDLRLIAVAAMVIALTPRSGATPAWLAIPVTVIAMR